MAEYDPMAAFVQAPEAAHTESQEEGGEDDDYDPSSFNSPYGDDNPQLVAPHRPKTIGGFVVDSDDDDDEQNAVRPPTAAEVRDIDPGPLDHGGFAFTDVKEGNIPTIHSKPQEDTAAVSSAPQTAQSAHLNGFTQNDSFLSETPAHVPLPRNTSATPIQTSVTLKQEKVISPVQDIGSTTQTTQHAVAASSTPAMSSSNITGVAQRLPHDKVGLLEDRIKEDPKAAVDAWKTLIAHYREKDQIDNVRKVYWRFLETFPSATSVWYDFAQLELEHENMQRVEEIFGVCLTQHPSVDTWNLYLDYLRRIHPLIGDTDGSKRGIISSAFEVVLDHVGLDPDAGKLWREYIEFIKSGPGIAGGSGWQDQQKMDLLRKAYQRAVRIPHSEYARLWKEYDAFEHSVNKATARQNLMAQSPHYMTARGARLQLEQKLDGIDRVSLPILPPLNGCAGSEAFERQVQKYQDWIRWEKDDPLVLKEDELSEYNKRVVYVYKQATMHLRFLPEIWSDAATWCFEQESEDMIRQGEAFLDDGISACPESVLLALMKADRVENTLEAGNSDEVVIRNGEKLDAPYERVHEALYALMKSMQEQLKKAMQEIEQHFASLPPEEENEIKDDDGTDDQADSDAERPKSRTEERKERIEEVQRVHGSRMDTLKHTISFAWVAKMRAFRRIQGQGTPGKPRKGFRGVFAEARPRGQLSSDVYTASALMEWHCYKDPSASKIFERGLKLFPMDERFALTYIEFLISRNDDVNARAVFETTITKVVSATSLNETQKRDKCRGLLDYMHRYESAYGDLAHIQRLEKRRKELFPNESSLARYEPRFDPGAFAGGDRQLVISPTQALPAATTSPLPQQAIPSIEQGHIPSPPEPNNIRLGPNGPYVASPKRPLEDSDTESTHRTKFLRGDSPLKGAAGRRLQILSSSGGTSSSTAGAATGMGGYITKCYVPGSVANLGPAPLPEKLGWLLSILPRADLYTSTAFDGTRIADLVRSIDLDSARARIGY